MTLAPLAPLARRGDAEVSATELYDTALDAHTAGVPARLWVRDADGSRSLPLARWCAAGPGDPADVEALEELRRELPPGAAVLDLGCGPGRHAAYLTDRGVGVLGVDTSCRAVALTRARGARAVRGDALDVPLTGRWDAVLLLDGNIGIGGDPHRLLRRVRELLTPEGRLLVELDVAGSTDAGAVRLSDGVRTSGGFPWARVARQDLPTVATAAGLAVLRDWTTDARAFALLGKVPS